MLHRVCTIPRPGARFSLGHYLKIWLHIRRLHGEIPGRTVLGEMHPAGARNTMLISDTAFLEVVGSCSLSE